MADTEVALLGQVDLSQYTEAANKINEGRKTTLVTSRAVLARELDGDEDYEAALALSNEAARVEKSMEDAFDAVCDLRHKLWKASTEERAKFAAPWKQLKDALREKARQWYLKQQEMKREAEKQLLQVVNSQQRELAAKAQERIDQGFVAQGRDIMAQAELIVAPILPDAAPKVAGSRVTPKFKATPVDLMEIIKAVAGGKFDLMWHVKGAEEPLLMVNQKVLNAICDRMGKGLRCPGILVEDDVRIGATRL
jgi:hypothetical protein